MIHCQIIYILRIILIIIISIRTTVVSLTSVVL